MWTIKDVAHTESLFPNETLYVCTTRLPFFSGRWRIDHRISISCMMSNLFPLIAEELHRGDSPRILADPV